MGVISDLIVGDSVGINIYIIYYVGDDWCFWYVCIGCVKFGGNVSVVCFILGKC